MLTHPMVLANWLINIISITMIISTSSWLVMWLAMELSMFSFAFMCDM